MCLGEWGCVAEMVALTVSPISGYAYQPPNIASNCPPVNLPGFMVRSRMFVTVQSLVPHKTLLIWVFFESSVMSMIMHVTQYFNLSFLHICFQGVKLSSNLLTWSWAVVLQASFKVFLFLLFHYFQSSPCTWPIRNVFFSLICLFMKPLNTDLWIIQA